MLSLANIKQAALEVGFDDCGVARADALSDEEYPLREWLRRGWHGDLGYMERNIDKRMDPRLLVPGAKSVICLVSAYPPPDSVGGTAAYARTREYHKEIKKMLHALCDRLSEIQDSRFEIQDSKLCCDTVPISDKRWAVRAGLGWTGRHTLFVTERWGSWVNLAEIVTTEECSEYDSDKNSIFDFRHSICQTCSRCVEACPNGALRPLAAGDSRFCIDVRRCTAYYTTHGRRPLPEGLETGGYTRGCDLCQMACPYNQKKNRVN